MKESLSIIGFIAFLWLLFSIPSCKGRETSLYECTITYTINGIPVTETFDDVELSSDYVPAYSCGGGRILLIGAGTGSYQYPYCEIINTSQELAVQDFDYKLIRSYRASRWTGREIQKRKK